MGIPKQTETTTSPRILTPDVKYLSKPNMLVSIKQFHEKLKSIGITYRYIPDEIEEYCKLEEALKKNSELSWYYRNQDKQR